MTNEDFLGALSTGMISAFSYGLGQSLSGQEVVYRRIIFIGITGTLVAMTLKSVARPIVEKMA